MWIDTPHAHPQHPCWADSQHHYISECLLPCPIQHIRPYWLLTLITPNWVNHDPWILWIGCYNHISGQLWSQIHPFSTVLLLASPQNYSSPAFSPSLLAYNFSYLIFLYLIPSCQDRIVSVCNRDLSMPRKSLSHMIVKAQLEKWEIYHEIYFDSA